MDIQLITTIISASFSLIGFFLGIVLYMRSDKKGYFGSFCCFGLMSFLAGHIFTVLLEIVGENSYYFSLGSLGTVSGLLLIAFACRTVQKVDLPEVGDTKKYNIIAAAAPAFIVICYIIMLAFRLEAAKMVIATLYLFSALPCSFICLKNAAAPYPKGSMLRSLRPFFVTVLVYCAVMMFSEVTWIFAESNAIIIVTCAVVTVSSLCMVLMPIFVERGNRKWTQI